ncbi:venom acid phosphatase Acph-1-like [Agrilus planipennis]|nr:venom acid phosphatase Acph-1-like [Agrilus planipennis]
MQMYTLGQQLRERYSDYLPEYYLPEEVLTYSSYSDRCLISAELLLAGLYPPVGQQIWNPDLLWQPIPVHYNPRNLDNIIAMKQPCKKYKEAFNEISAVRLNESIKKYPDIYRYLTEHTGSEIKTIGDIEFLYSTLEIEDLNNLTLPNWTKRYYPEPMKTLTAESLALYSYTPLLKRLSGGVFLKNVTDNMLQKVENNTTNKLILFSGHDLTVVNVMRSLGLDELLKPEFAATIIFELHKEREVKVLYKKNVNDDFNEMSIPGCQSSCELSNLVKVLDPVLPKNWNEECIKNVIV